MKRIEKVQQLLTKHQLDALIVDHPIDLFYMTQLNLSLGRLVATKSACFLFVDGRYFEKAKQHSDLVVKLTKGYGPDSSFAKEAEQFGKKIGFDSLMTSYQDYQDLLHLQKEFIPLKSPLKKIREIKENSEIESLRQAAKLGSLGYDHLLSLVKEGVTESDLAKQLEIFWLKSGAEKLAFDPNIGFGPNSAYPHHRAGKQTLAKENAILIDIGVVKESYYSDMTRVVFFKKPFSELEKIYHIVREAQSKALEKCRAGTLIKEVDAAARDWITQKGYGEYFPHSLGHGVGLEIHELPVIRAKGEDADRPLEENMVITIEPGIYLPGIGGVRLEDTIVIKKEGFVNLTDRPLSSGVPIIT